jgi:hypothetical protein
MNAIMRAHPEWIPRDQVSPQNSPLISLSNGCAFSFSSVKFDLWLEGSVDNGIDFEGAGSFAAQVDALSAIVIDELGLDEFTRIGLRAWYLFRCDSTEDSERWLRTLGVVQVSERVTKAFGGEIESVSGSLVIVGQERKYRIGFNAAEKSAEINRGSETVVLRQSGLTQKQDAIYKRQLKQKRYGHGAPVYAAVVDIDAYVDNPHSVEPRDFVETSRAKFLAQLGSALAS